MKLENKVIPFIPYYIKTSHLHDVKVSDLKSAYGCKGYAVYGYIENEIFRTVGCALPWCENTKSKVADYWELPAEEVERIVEHCINVDLFSAELYTKYHVLSSADIRQRYKNASACTFSKEVYAIPVQACHQR